MDVIKQLTDESAEVANRMDAVRSMECVDADAVAARDLELESLSTRAGNLTKKLSFEHAVAEQAKSLRSVVDRCTPAVDPAKTQRARIEPVAYRGKLRAYKDPAEAFTVGQWIKAQYAGTPTHASGVPITASRCGPWASRPTPPAVPSSPT